MIFLLFLISFSITRKTITMILNFLLAKFSSSKCSVDLSIERYNMYNLQHVETLKNAGIGINHYTHILQLYLFFASIN